MTDESEASSGKFLGIDLGTTNSAVAIMEGGEPTILRNNEGKQLTPSTVAYQEDGTVRVGAPAERMAPGKPDRVVRSVKRHMGDDHHVERIGDEEYTPVEISAEITKKLRSDAESHIDNIEGVVITVPAYFNDDQKKDTIAAGELAGFDDPILLNEPTAAALAHGYVHDAEGTIIVYDFGGGTLDVSVVDIEDDTYTVKVYHGDMELGGDDYDEAIVDWIADDYEDEHGVDIRGDQEAYENLRELAEQAKKELSQQEKTEIIAPYIGEVDGENIQIDRELTRERFEEMTADLRDRAMVPLEDAMDAADLDAGEMETVLLVGGSTKMPSIREAVEETAGVEPIASIEPNEIVSKGAAVRTIREEISQRIEAEGIEGLEPEDVEEEDLEDLGMEDVRKTPVTNEVLPRSLGTKLKDGSFSVLLERATPVEDAQNSKLYTTVEDDQSKMLIDVYQGENEMAEDNVHLDEFLLTGIPERPAGEATVEVTFALDENGTLHVEAQALDSDDVSGEIKVEQANQLRDIESEDTAGAEEAPGDD